MTEQAATPTDQELLVSTGEHLTVLIDTSLDLMRRINPAVEPLAAVQEVFRYVCDALQLTVPDPVIQMALLVTYEGRHDRPMTFIDLNKAKQQLARCAAARARVEGRSVLIIPGGADD